MMSPRTAASILICLVVFGMGMAEEAAAQTPTPTPVSFSRDFAGSPTDRAGWISSVILGDPAFNSANALGGQGLCMTVEAPGDNFVGWTFSRTSPPAALLPIIPLIDEAVYRVRTDMSSDTDLGSTPLFAFGYDNTVRGQIAPDGSVQNEYFRSPVFGGEYYVLDNLGGANRIVPPTPTPVSGNGRSQFDFWIAPAPMKLASWRTAAFTSSVDPYNDIGLNFRVLDSTQAGIGAEGDSGTICVRKIQVNSYWLGALAVETPLWAPEVRPYYFAGQTGAQAGEAAGEVEFMIRTGSLLLVTAPQPAPTPCSLPAGPAPTPYSIGTVPIVRYKLASGAASPSGAIKTFFPYQPSLQATCTPIYELGEMNDALYPIPWNSNELFLIEGDVRGHWDGTSEGNRRNPVDVIQVNATMPTTELLASNYVTRGVPARSEAGSRAAFLDKAGSPRLPTPYGAEGGPQPYVSLFYTHNTTKADLNAPTLGYHGNHWAPTLQFLNGNPNILGDGTDPFAVYSLTVRRLAAPP